MPSCSTRPRGRVLAIRKGTAYVFVLVCGWFVFISSFTEYMWLFAHSRSLVVAAPCSCVACFGTRERFELFGPTNMFDLIAFGPTMFATQVRCEQCCLAFECTTTHCRGTNGMDDTTMVVRLPAATIALLHTTRDGGVVGTAHFSGDQPASTSM